MSRKDKPRAVPERRDDRPRKRKTPGLAEGPGVSSLWCHVGRGSDTRSLSGRWLTSPFGVAHHLTMPPSERSDQDMYDMHALGKDLKEWMDRMKLLAALRH